MFPFTVSKPSPDFRAVLFIRPAVAALASADNL